MMSVGELPTLKWDYILFIDNVLGSFLFNSLSK